MAPRAACPSHVQSVGGSESRQGRLAVNTSDVQNAIMKWRGYPSKASLMPKDFYEFAAFIGYHT
jgi:hypothetical protein